MFSKIFLKKVEKKYTLSKIFIYISTRIRNLTKNFRKDSKWQIAYKSYYLPNLPPSLTS